MPTFTAISLDVLLEPSSRSPAPGPVKLGRVASEKTRPPLPAASPALYATPDTTPLPGSPSSFAPSPYIVNHKRRGPRLLKSLSQNDVGGGKLELQQKAAADGFVCGGEEIVRIEDGDKLGDGVVGGEGRGKRVVVDREKDGVKGEGFFNLQHLMSKVSNDSYGMERLLQPSTPMGEFFDALEEISSEGSTPSAYQNVENELCEMRLNVLMETARRKQAEKALENLQDQWQRLSHQLSLVGLSLPAPLTTAEETVGQSNLDPAEELCRQVVIARFVASSIGRGCSRAEVELEIEPQIETKNFEIARLWDRLQYYEATNREMSQRNQEAVEAARQHRLRRKRRRKWIWASIGLTVSIGTAALAWSYLPHSKPPSSHGGETASSHGNTNQPASST